jgi:nucleotide-binding universal stress UspA family protein
MRLLLLIDGFRTAELLAALSRAVPLSEAELVLVHVAGPNPRAGFEMLRRRPGGHRLPPHRKLELTEAEEQLGAAALAEAKQLAQPDARAVMAVQVEGEPGRTVCEIAAKDGIDLVALRAGGRGQPAMGPASLGPAARYIADHCPCPVLLLRGGR